MTGRIKTGLLSVGLNTYWKQFDGLHARLEALRATISDRIAGFGAEVVDDESKSVSAAALFRERSVEIVFLHVATYTLSSTVLPVVRSLGLPVIVLAIQPEAAMDCEAINSMGDRRRITGEWLAHCQACALPEIACVFNRASIRYEVVAGYMAHGSR